MAATDHRRQNRLSFSGSESDGSEDDSVSLGSSQLDGTLTGSQGGLGAPSLPPLPSLPPSSTPNAASVVGVAITDATPTRGQGTGPHQKKRRSRKSRQQDWDIVEGLKDGQKCLDKPERYQGYLMKRRKWPMKGWHKRFFVLEMGILTYAKTGADIQKGKYHGIVDIGLAVITFKRNEQRMDIDAEEQVHHLKVKDKTMFDDWMSRLRHHRLYRQHEIAYGSVEAPRLFDIKSPTEEIPTLTNANLPEMALNQSLKKDIIRQSSFKSGQGRVMAWLLDSAGFEQCGKYLQNCQGELLQLKELLERIQTLPITGDVLGMEHATTTPPPDYLDRAQQKRQGFRTSSSTSASASSITTTNNNATNAATSSSKRHSRKSDSYAGTALLRDHIQGGQSLSTSGQTTPTPTPHLHPPTPGQSDRLHQSASNPNLLSMYSSSSNNANSEHHHSGSTSNVAKTTTTADRSSYSGSTNSSGSGSSSGSNSSSNNSHHSNNNDYHHHHHHHHNNGTTTTATITTNHPTASTNNSGSSSSNSVTPLLIPSASSIPSTTNPNNNNSNSNSNSNCSSSSSSNRQQQPSCDSIFNFTSHEGRIQDIQNREKFLVKAGEVQNRLKDIFTLMGTERDRLRKSLEQDSGEATAGQVAVMKNALLEAQKQNNELRARLSRIHADSAPPDALAPPTMLSPAPPLRVSHDNKADLTLTQSLSLDSFSMSEYYDAEENIGTISDSSESERSDDDASSEISEDGNETDVNQVSVSEFTAAQSICATGRRTRLPVPKPETPDVSMWNLLYRNIGKDLTKISMPVTLNEPLSMLQRLCEELEYSELLDKAAEYDDPYERMIYIAAFAVSSYASSYYREGHKPFNPLLGETYEAIREDKGWRFVAEQVSHHPPISACYCESRNFTFWQDVRMKTKFWGKSMEIQPLGHVHVFLPKYREHYKWNKVTTCVHNLLGGQRWADQYGEMTISNNNIVCKLTFTKGANHYSSKRYEVYGNISTADGKVVHNLFGKWNEAFFCGHASSAKCIWRPGAMPEDHELYYGFTRFAIELNELDPDMSKFLPPTDSRFRPDQRLMEEGKIQEAENEKHRLENSQRDRRKKRESEKIEEQQALWFKKTLVNGKESYEYNNRYWEHRKDPGFSRMSFMPVY